MTSILEQIGEIAKTAEKQFNLPPLSKVTGSLEKVPDSKQLKLIKDLLDTVERVSKVAPELDKVTGLIRELNSIPIEKLAMLDKLLRRAEKVIKMAPPEIVDFLRDAVKGG